MNDQILEEIKYQDYKTSNAKKRQLLVWLWINRYSYIKKIELRNKIKEIKLGGTTGTVLKYSEIVKYDNKDNVIWNGGLVPNYDSLIHRMMNTERELRVKWKNNKKLSKVKYSQNTDLDIVIQKLDKICKALGIQ